MFIWVCIESPSNQSIFLNLMSSSTTKNLQSLNVIEIQHTAWKNTSEIKSLTMETKYALDIRQLAAENEK